MIGKKCFSINQISVKNENTNINNDDSIDDLNDNLSLNSLNIFCDIESKDRYKLMYNALIDIGFSPRLINNCYRIFSLQNISEFIEKLVKLNGLDRKSVV